MMNLLDLLRGTGRTKKSRKQHRNGLASARTSFGLELLEGREVPAISFLNPVEVSLFGDPLPLIGPPTVVTGTLAFFEPTQFRSSATGNASDSTGSRYTYTLDASGNDVIDTIQVAQGGDVSLQGIANGSASASIVTSITVTISELNGFINSNVQQTFNITFAPNGGSYSVNGAGRVATRFDGSVTIDIDNILALAGVQGQATRVDVLMETTLTSNATGGANAFIQLKDDPVVFAAAALLGSIGDRVWLDTNADGVQDPGEVGINGVTVEMTYFGANGVPGGGDDVVTSQVTAGDGNYFFGNLVAGNYQVRVTNRPPNLDETHDRDQPTPAQFPDAVTIVQLAAAQQVVDADFGFVLIPVAQSQAVLQGQVYVDVNNNGVIDNGEIGIEGATIRLVNVNNNTFTDVLTGPTGYYEFNAIPVGNYRIVQVQTGPVLNYIDGKDTVGTLGTNGQLPGAISATNDQLGTIAIVTGAEIGLGYNFGEQGLLTTVGSKRLLITGTMPNFAGQVVLAGLQNIFGPNNPALFAAMANPTVANSPAFNINAFAGAFVQLNALGIPTQPVRSKATPGVINVT